METCVPGEPLGPREGPGVGQVVSSPGMECHISGAWGSGILACCLVGLAGVSTLSNNLDAVLMLSGMLSQEGSGGESKRTGRGGVPVSPPGVLSSLGPASCLWGSAWFLVTHVCVSGLVNESEVPCRYLAGCVVQPRTSPRASAGLLSLPSSEMGGRMTRPHSSGD